jgi:hypothetical protein
VDPVPDPPPLRKSGSAGNRIRDLWVSSQELWPLDHRRGRPETTQIGMLIRENDPSRQHRERSFLCLFLELREVKVKASFIYFSENQWHLFETVMEYGLCISHLYTRSLWMFSPINTSDSTHAGRKGYKPQFVPNREHITSLLQSAAG